MTAYKDITYCTAIGCPLRSNCQRTPLPVGNERVSAFMDVPYDPVTNSCEMQLPIITKWETT